MEADDWLRSPLKGTAQRIRQWWFGARTSVLACEYFIFPVVVLWKDIWFHSWVIWSFLLIIDLWFLCHFPTASYALQLFQPFWVFSFKLSSFSLIVRFNDIVFLTYGKQRKEKRGDPTCNRDNWKGFMCLQYFFCCHRYKYFTCWLHTLTFWHKLEGWVSPA